jgi:hypothetical protein
LDDLTRNLLELLSSGAVESVRVEAVLKPAPPPPSSYTPVISLSFGPDFDPPKTPEL